MVIVGKQDADERLYADISDDETTPKAAHVIDMLRKELSDDELQHSPQQKRSVTTAIQEKGSKQPKFIHIIASFGSLNSGLPALQELWSWPSILLSNG
jgi:hypothetical protein